MSISLNIVQTFAITLAVAATLILIIRKAKEKLEDPKTTIPRHDVPIQYTGTSVPKTLEENIDRIKDKTASPEEKVQNAKEAFEGMFKGFGWNMKSASKSQVKKPKASPFIFLGIMAFFMVFGWVMERGENEDGSTIWGLVGPIIFFVIIAALSWKFRKNKVVKR